LLQLEHLSRRGPTPTGGANGERSGRILEIRGKSIASGTVPKTVLGKQLKKGRSRMLEGLEVTDPGVVREH